MVDVETRLDHLAGVAHSIRQGMTEDGWNEELATTAAGTFFVNGVESIVATKLDSSDQPTLGQNKAYSDIQE